MNLVTLVLLFAPVLLVIVVVRKRAAVSRVRAATVAIEADSDGVRRTLADGRTEGVSWDEVTEVDVFRTRVGPHKPAGGGVVLYGTLERGCIVPLDKLEQSGLLAHIHHLPGIEIATIIRAVSADDDQSAGRSSALELLSPRPLQSTTTCWTRPPDPDG